MKKLILILMAASLAGLVGCASNDVNTCDLGVTARYAHARGGYLPPTDSQGLTRGPNGVDVQRAGE